ncbi:ead/Ea22-like family protein, partial [Pseudomonas aeruginosa]
EAATPGPWVTDAQQNGAIFNIESESGDMCIAMSQENPAPTRLEINEQRRANAEWIAAANPKTILALLDEIDRLKAENEALRESLQALIHISDATGWEDHTCGEIAKARAALEGGGR